jgi:tripartite-type tricarboxylate transporter receptor subunit TctC
MARSFSRRDALRAAAALGAAPFAARSAFAQAFPAKPVRFIVPFAAGGPTDVMTRAVAATLSAKTGQQWLVENRPGAGGNIAASFVASQPADGYTLLVAGQGILAINKPLYGKLTYEPERDFTWIGMLGSLPNVTIVNADAAPVATMKELLDLARSKPGQISYGSNGIGSLSHLQTEVMAQMAGVKFLHVPYQGAAPQRTDLLAGRIAFTQVGASTAIPLLSPKIRALAVSTGKRSTALPDIPTLIESGFPGLDIPVWFAAVAHSATPAPAVATLRELITSATADNGFRSEMAKQYSSSEPVSPAQADAMLANERKIWTEAVKITGASAS